MKTWIYWSLAVLFPLLPCFAQERPASGSRPGYVRDEFDGSVTAGHDFVFGDGTDSRFFVEAVFRGLNREHRPWRFSRWLQLTARGGLSYRNGELALNQATAELLITDYTPNALRSGFHAYFGRARFEHDDNLGTLEQIEVRPVTAGVEFGDSGFLNPGAQGVMTRVVAEALGYTYARHQFRSGERASGDFIQFLGFRLDQRMQIHLGPQFLLRWNTIHASLDLNAGVSAEGAYVRADLRSGISLIHTTPGHQRFLQDFTLSGGVTFEQIDIGSLTDNLVVPNLQAGITVYTNR